MKTVILLFLLCVLATMGLLSRSDSYNAERPVSSESGRADRSIVFRVLGPFSKDEVWIQPMHPPPMTVRIETGVMPAKGVLLCSETKTVVRKAKESDVVFSYPVVVLKCENGLTLSITGIDLH